VIFRCDYCVCVCVCVWRKSVTKSCIHVSQSVSTPWFHHILCQSWESLQSRQLDILLPKYMAMLKLMSNYSFKWVGLYPRNICGPPPSTPDLDIPNVLILRGMPRRSDLSFDMLWGQMVPHPTAAPPTCMTPSITSRLCILFKTGRRTSSTLF